MKRDTTQFDFNIDEQKPLYKGFYKMDQLTITHQKFNGENLTVKRELMDRPDAVCVLLVDLSKDTCVFVEQFRVGATNQSNPWLIELVAGLIDKDEPPEEVARREALEEAGVSLGRMEPICQYLPSPGGTNEKIYLFVAEVDSTKATGLHGLEEEGEDIRVLTTHINQAYEYVTDGTFCNAASIIALQWLQLNEQRLRQLWV